MDNGMGTQTPESSEVDDTVRVTLEQPYDRAPPPPPPGGVGLCQILRRISAGGDLDTDVAAECRTRIMMAQGNIRQETALTQEEES